ncbi:MAG: methylated-DNA--[protein]-cysteine S-methyltransferase [Deltaproteobacteria bacterium]|jgi:methylated-DNA-[protein]-cysteine S-methyltransferase|nr:methylated-DNA--[protein]-cysteine S-methyltransferase [Deltaproteobacteria bacterium]
MPYLTTYDSPYGLLTLASEGQNLIGLWIEGQKYHGPTVADNPHDLNGPKDHKDPKDLEVFKKTKKWLDRYFEGRKPRANELPFLEPKGGIFRREVWGYLKEIPYGELTTYGAIAKKIAAKANIAKMAAQAVGGAVGHNPISIIIPCHRVVGQSGSLVGYGGGLDTKVKLLTFEGVDMTKLFRPKKGTAL